MRKNVPNKLRVFLCHATEDKPTVRELYERLNSDSHDVWLDEIRLMPGQNWKLEILKGIRNADVIIICLSSVSVEKDGYIQVEIKEALELAKQKPEGTIFIIPLKLDNCEVPVSLEDKQWVNFFEEDGFNKLRRGLIYCKKMVHEKNERLKEQRKEQITIEADTKINPDLEAKKELNLVEEKLFLSAADFSISSEWVKWIPDYIIESFTSAEPPIIFLGSGFGKEAIPPQKTDGELAVILRHELGLKDNNDNLSELLQYLKIRAGNGRRVIDWLKKNSGYGSTEPGGAYRLLLSLPCKIFLTTSYDSLLSDTSIQMGYRLINLDDPHYFDSNYDDIKSRNQTGLLGRLRGAFDNQKNLVATTDDYISEAASRYHWGILLREIFLTRPVIFIGYSLKDFTTWNSFISVFNETHKSVYSPIFVSSAVQNLDYANFFWSKYNIRYIPLKAYQFLIAIHEQLGNLEKNEQIAISALASCLGKTYDETKKEVEIQRKLRAYPSLVITAIKMSADYFGKKSPPPSS